MSLVEDNGISPERTWRGMCVGSVDFVTFNQGDTGVSVEVDYRFMHMGEFSCHAYMEQDVWYLC